MSTRFSDAPNSQIAEILGKNAEAAALWNVLKRINGQDRLEIVNYAFKDIKDTRWFGPNDNKEKEFKAAYGSKVRIFYGKTWEDAQDFADVTMVWGAPEDAQINAGSGTARNVLFDAADRIHRSKELGVALHVIGDEIRKAVTAAAQKAGLGSTTDKTALRAVRDAELYVAFLIVEDKLDKVLGKEVKEQIRQLVQMRKDAWDAGCAVLCDADGVLGLYVKDDHTYYYEMASDEKRTPISSLKRDEPNDDADKPFLWN